jgi:hypothetical protein
MFSTSSEVTPNVRILKKGNARPPAAESSGTWDNLFQNIFSLQGQPKEVHLAPRVEILSATASAPHLSGDHRVWWFNYEDILGWEDVLKRLNPDVIEDVLNQQISDDHADDNFIVGINLGHRSQFGNNLIEPAENAFQRKAGLQSISAAHIHLMYPDDNLENEIEEVPLTEMNLQHFFKLRDFAGEAATRYLRDDILPAIKMFDGVESVYNLDGTLRTIYEFASLKGALHAAYYIQHQVPEVQAKWHELTPEKLYETYYEGTNLKHEDFLQYGKQFPVPCMLIARQNNGMWTLVPFSAGISAAEFFGEYALVREYDAK